MENDIYEKARDKYKPSKVKILFVGESRPNSGKFFYIKKSDDRYLYKYTKILLNKQYQIRKSMNINCRTFKYVKEVK